MKGLVPRFRVELGPGGRRNGEMRGQPGISVRCGWEGKRQEAGKPR